MPDVTIDVVTPSPSSQGASEMADVEKLAEPGNLISAMTILANGAAAGANRRTDSADQLSADTQRMWAIAMTTPTVMAAQGIRTMTESGSGRTRLEANRPVETGAAGA